MVNAEGELTQYIYSEFDEVLTTRVYGQRLSTAQLSQLEGGVLTDARGLVITKVDGEGYDTALSYDGFGRLIATDSQISGSQRTTTTYGYNAKGELLETRFDSGEGKLNQTISKQYDVFGRVISETDRQGYTTQFEYDKVGQRTAVIYDNGARMEQLFDAFGRVVLSRDGEGNETTYQYAKDGRQLVTTSAAGVVSTSVLNGVGEVIGSIDGNGDKTQYLYDDAGRLVFKLSANGAGEAFVYDNAGRLLSTTRYAQVQAQLADDTLTAASIAAFTDVAENRQDKSVYDSVGQEVYQIDAMGYLTSYEYDTRGNQISTTRFSSVLSQAQQAFTRAQLDTLSESLAVSNQVHNVFDNNDRVRFVVDNAGKVESREYDGLGQVVSRTDYGKSISADNDMTVASVTAALSGSETRTQATYYDAVGRVRFTIDAAGFVSEIQYLQGNSKGFINYDVKLMDLSIVGQASAESIT